MQLTFDQVNGTGRFANVQNQGTAEGSVVSPTEVVVEFHGLLTEVQH